MYLKILLVRGNYFHANCLFSLNTDAQKRNIYIPLLHIVSVNSHQLGLHSNSLKRFCYFGNKKRLDSYLMVQKTSVAVLSHGAIILFSVFSKTKYDEFRFQPLLVTSSIPCIIITSFLRRGKHVPQSWTKKHGMIIHLLWL